MKKLSEKTTKMPAKIKKMQIPKFKKKTPIGPLKPKRED